MNRQLKKIAAATILALGLPASAYAIQGVSFDGDGTGGAIGVQIVRTFDWGPAHVLYSGCFGTTGLGDPPPLGGSSCTVYAQGAISALKAPDDTNLTIPAGVIYTFTLVTKAKSGSTAGYNGIGPTLGDTLTFENITGGDSTALFTIYKGVAGSVVPLTGAGYVRPASDIILTGSVDIVDFTLTNIGVTTQTLDKSGADNWAGLQTLSTGGTPTFNINVLTTNTDYFTDNPAKFALQLVDAQQADASIAPFTTVDPSASVAGKAFSKAITGVDGVDDIYCGGGAGAGPCSGEFQGDASTTFLVEVVPEPGMLALLGIGLAGLGTFARRRKA